MMRVLWFSRHDLTKEQKDGLRFYFKDEIEVKGVAKTVESAQEIVDYAIRFNCNILAVVLPVHLLSDLMKLAPFKAMHIVVPRSKRILNEDNTVTFAYDGWEHVEYCDYKSRTFK